LKVRNVSDADVRLAGSEIPGEGRLEVKVASIWGTVCDDHFNYVDAGAACSMLGYGYVLGNFFCFIGCRISLHC